MTNKIGLKIRRGYINEEEPQCKDPGRETRRKRDPGPAEGNQVRFRNADKKKRCRQKPGREKSRGNVVQGIQAEKPVGKEILVPAEEQSSPVKERRRDAEAQTKTL